MNKIEQIAVFCKSLNITEEQFYGKEEIEESLYLESLISIPEGFNPTVGGYLVLKSLTSIPAGFNPSVGGYLDLSSLTSIPSGFNPTVGRGLYLKSLTSIPAGFNPTVGGDLNLNSLTSIPEGFNPTVGGDLNLSSLKSIPEGFNPTVGGSLVLESLISIPEGFNPIVGDYLDLKFKYEALKNLPKDYVFSWQNGKYILVDGIFCEVIAKKRNVFTCKKINNNNQFFIVTDNEGNYSHGDTIKEAKEDLIFKISNRDKSNYEGLDLDSVLTYAEAIKCYRIITGACSFGTKDFCNNRLKKKATYSIKEIIELTANEHGNKKLAEYFTSK